MVTREISSYFKHEESEVDVCSPRHMELDLEKVLDEYESDDEQSCDAVPLGAPWLALHCLQVSPILEEVCPKDSEL